MKFGITVQFNVREQPRRKGYQRCSRHRRATCPDDHTHPIERF